VPSKAPAQSASSGAAPSATTAVVATSTTTDTTPLSTLIADFAGLSIPGLPPPTDLSAPPPCPIAEIPHEIMIEILFQVALTDVGSLGSLAQVCKRFAYLMATEDRIWKRIACGSEFGFAAQHYRFACTVEGEPLDIDSLGGGRVLQDTNPLLEHSDSAEASGNAPSSEPRMVHLPLDTTYASYRQMFQARPRIRFNGCYISTVNYFRAGAATQTTWMNPCIIGT
jgi:F-box protein 9